MENNLLVSLSPPITSRLVLEVAINSLLCSIFSSNFDIFNCLIFNSVSNLFFDLEFSVIVFWRSDISCLIKANCSSAVSFRFVQSLDLEQLATDLIILLISRVVSLAFEINSFFWLTKSRFSFLYELIFCVKLIISFLFLS